MSGVVDTVVFGIGWQTGAWWLVKWSSYKRLDAKKMLGLEEQSGCVHRNSFILLHSVWSSR